MPRERGMMETEKRRHQRLLKKLIVVFKYKSLDHFVKAVTENVSLGGLCLQVEKDIGLREEQMINLQFQLEGTREIVEIEGQVKWISRNADTQEVQIGVEFLKLDDPKMSQLKDKLQQLLESS
jgi:c-di-GMP-binding flagellar brake protein YcgR